MDGSFAQMSHCYEFIESRQSDECSCPEEDWIVGNRLAKCTCQ